VRFQEQIDEHVGERSRVVVDLVIALVRSQRRVLQSVERALAGERRAVCALGLEPVGEQGEHRVVAQLVVVAHILIAERDADDPLPDQGRETVHHLILLAVVLKARRDPLDQPNRAIGTPQQQPAGVGGHGPAVERRHHTSPLEAFKLELFGATAADLELELALRALGHSVPALGSGPAAPAEIGGIGPEPRARTSDAPWKKACAGNRGTDKIL
jgi:hypothetical protein